MLITIIFIIIGVVFGILSLIMALKGLDWEYEGLFFVSIFFVITGGCGAGICGLIVGIKNCQQYKVTVRSELNEEINSLNFTYETLKSAEGTGYTYTAIQQYNEKVSEVRTKIIVNQKCLKNPWISWFTCSAYNEFDAEALKYL